MNKCVLIDIAVGESRKAKFKNKQIPWDDFAKRCTAFTFTAETPEEYAEMSRDDRGSVKDVGGFIGGTLKQSPGGHGRANIASRTLLTIDLDHCTPTTGDELHNECKWAAVCYSTHSHTADEPRLRVVIPLSRPIEGALEYEAVSRYACNELALMEAVDSTTHQFSRLFYWPSASKGAAVYQWMKEGDALDVDAVLRGYGTTDYSAVWPLHPGERHEDFREMRKAGDPLEKPGLIGAFCRAYSIEEAIETFLSDVYEPTALPGRYTYRAGSVAGGLVIYDNGKFAYANNETDPASRKLCNAFDLVRIHKFGKDDEGVSAETSDTDKPSFKNMIEFCKADSKTRAQVLSDEFADINLEGEGGAGTDDVSPVDFDPMTEPLYKLDTRFLDPFAPIPPILTWTTMGDRPAFPCKGLITISAKPKQGKSTAVYASLIPIITGCDFGALKPTERRPRLVVVFDTEMDDTTLAGRVKGMLKALGDNAPKFQVLSLVGNPKKDRIRILQEVTAKYRPDIVVIDQIARLVTDFNEQKECTAFGEFLAPYATQRTVITVIHQNKSADNAQMKGHLGSILEELAVENYSVSRKNGVFTLKPINARQTYVDEDTIGFDFAIADDGTIITADAIKAQNEKNEAEKLRKEFGVYFGDNPEIRHNALAQRIARITGKSIDTAKRSIDRAATAGVIEKINRGDRNSPYRLTDPANDFADIDCPDDDIL